MRRIPSAPRFRLSITLLVVATATPLRAQQLAPCPTAEFGPRADCGTLAVWEDRAAGIGRRIDIRFVVLRAAGARAPEPVFMFAGGPGAGSTTLAELANGPLAPVRETRHIVLVDQRGTGGSNPLPCPTDAATNPAAAFGHVFDPAVMRRCRVELSRRADLALYTTDLAVQDVDDVRRFLGYDRVIVAGGSYGTRMAQAYARRYPERVKALVLDGVVPFDFAAPSTYARSLQQSIERVLRSCRERSSCRDSFPALEAEFDTLVARFGKGPITATVTLRDGGRAPVTMHLGDFGYAVRGILYAPGLTRRLPAMIHHAASTGDVSEFAQRYWLRAMDFEHFADGLHLSVFCAEDVPNIRDEDVDSLTRGAFIGRYLIDEYRGACAEWDGATVDPDLRRPLASEIPTLLLSGWFDPVTPPETAERVARTLPMSRQVVDPQAGHGSSVGCARRATLHVLINGSLDGLPAVCESPPG